MTSTHSLPVALCTPLSSLGHVLFLTSKLTPTFQPRGTYRRKDDFRDVVTLKHVPFILYNIFCDYYSALCS